jgi:ammonium transporter Rh
MVFIPGHEAGHVISIGLPQMIQAFFSVGSCLISTGALLGRTHPLDLIIMVILEMIPYTLVEILIFNVLGLQDAGGSMNIHMFGAYFGIAVSTILGKRHSYGDNLPTVSYNSGIFAMIGTLFLWIYWPSFNSALISHLMVY